ncbi:MAG TPA: PEGA domain-containing protein, partial [Chroococcales cyanobacterium]
MPKKFKRFSFFLGCFFFSVTPAWSVSFDEAVGSTVRQLIKNPAGLRSLAVRGVHEEKTLARWPFSDQVEEAIASGLAAAHPPFAILNFGTIGKMNAGRDAVLTGTYSREGKKILLSLFVQDKKGTIFSLQPIEISEISEISSLPAGALPEVGFGKLVVDVDVPAQVFVDGKPSGKGSQIIPLPLGSHLLTVVYEGYSAYDAPVTIREDASVVATVHLSRQASEARFESNLTGVKVSIDGHERGNTPLVLADLTLGKHQVLFSKLGCRNVEKSFEIGPSRPQLLLAELSPLPGKLVVTADVPDATVELDGHPVGKAPLLVPEVAIGSHRLRVSAVGYTALEQEIAMASDQTLPVRARLSIPSGEDETGYQMVALLPASRSKEDADFLQAVLSRLPRDLAAAPDRKILDRFLPEASPEAASLKKLAHFLKARQILFLGVENYSPFQRVAGFWPVPPRLETSLEVFSSSGLRQGEKRSFALEGEEPLGFGDKTPLLPELSARIAPRIAAEISGEEPLEKKASSQNSFLLNTGTLLFGSDHLQAGFGYERRLNSIIGLGFGYLYTNSLGTDRKAGTPL